jgi:hypothetical protein
MTQPKPVNEMTGAELVAAHVAECTEACAAIVVDGSADDTIDRLVADGWTNTGKVEYIAGKRIRYLVPPGRVALALADRDTDPHPQCGLCGGHCTNGAECSISQFLGIPRDWREGPSDG